MEESANQYKDKSKRIIHRLLKEIFSDREFDGFCHENYPEVADQFTSEMGLGEKIRLLIEFCAQKKQLKTLLDQIKQAKPEAYENFVQQVTNDAPAKKAGRTLDPIRDSRSLRSTTEINATKNNLLENETLASRYRLEEVLDRTGLGAVFKAYDQKLEIDVAIKVIDLSRVDQPNILQQRIQQEVRTAIRLDHPCIVKIYDFGQVGNLFYIVMAYVPGYNLEQARQTFKHLPLPQLLHFCRRICLTVDYMHQHQVVHPGTKPKNILLKPEKIDDGQAWNPILINLGLLRPNREVLESGNISTARLAYMVSPELLLGHTTDTRSDIYTLGILLYDTLVGQPPFWPPDLEAAIELHVEAPVPAPRSINANLPEPIEKILFKALAKNPADRYLSAKELAQALEDCIDGVSLPGRTMQQQEQAPALPLTDLDVTLEGRPPVVTPGETSFIRVKLQNNGTQEDHRQIRVEGVPPEWTTISPSTILLTPKEKGEVEIAIQPPYAPQSLAGRRAITIHFVNQHDPDQVEEIKTTLTIAPYQQFESHLWPKELSGAQTTQISIENQGNAAETFTIEPQEHGNLIIEPTQKRLKIEAGQRDTADFEVLPPSRLIGDPETQTFSFEITTSSEQTAIHTGQVTNRGAIPVRVALVSTLAVLLCACAAVLFYLQAPALVAEQASLIMAQQATATRDEILQETEIQAATATAFIATAQWEQEDSDRDGLTNEEEVDIYNTDPNQPDTDGDRLPDGAEVNEFGTNPNRADSDFDGISDYDEVRYVLDPESRDTDGDGIPDSLDDTPNQASTATPQATTTTPEATQASLRVGFSERQPFLTRSGFTSPPSYSVSRNVGRAILEISLNQPADRQIQVEYYLENTTAIAGQDYRFSPGTLVFQPGEQIKTIEVEILDMVSDINRVMVLGLRNPSPGVNLGIERVELVILRNS